jgi:hypothetical protein
MNRSRSVTAALWIAAFAVTVMLAVFQRMTGPSHPARGSATLPNGETISYKMPRSNEGRETLRIAVPEPSAVTRAILEWRRFPTDEPFRSQTMTVDAVGQLETRIPPQPAAGKVEYRILLEVAGETISVPATETVVARYRGDVPAQVLIPHILIMFLSMLLSTRALFEVLRPGLATGCAARTRSGAGFDGSPGRRWPDPGSDRPAICVWGVLDGMAFRPRPHGQQDVDRVPRMAAGNGVGLAAGPDKDRGGARVGCDDGNFSDSAQRSRLAAGLVAGNAR